MTTDISSKPVAVVTGANRGLGLAAAEGLARRGYSVVLTARDASKAQICAARLVTDGFDVVPCGADVANPETLLPVAELVVSRYGRLDTLVNNAGVLLEGNRNASVFETPFELIELAFRVNTLGALAAARALAPVMRKRGTGCIVNVSSGMGGITEMGGTHPAYRFSKAALNALTRILASELSDTKIRVNSVCPGWVRTDMGGSQATRTIQEGVAGILWAATLPPDGPTGGFFRDGKPLAF